MPHCRRLSGWRWTGTTGALRYRRSVAIRESLRADPRRLRVDEEGRRGAIGFTVRQAATALGVSTGSIRRWSDIGRLETTRTPGGQRRFSQEQIDAFIGSLSPTQIPTSDDPAS
jgi:excisionase family DNA binding protein